MELLELKRKIETLHQSVTNLVQELQSALKETDLDNSTDGNAKKVTFLLMHGVLLAMMACLVTAGQVLKTADVHDRTRGNPNISGLTL